jgi:hypothetical protein
MIKNATQEFRNIILFLINETVEQPKLPENQKSSLISIIPKNKTIAAIQKIVGQ